MSNTSGMKEVSVTSYKPTSSIQIIRRESVPAHNQSRTEQDGEKRSRAEKDGERRSRTKQDREGMKITEKDGARRRWTEQ